MRLRTSKIVVGISIALLCFWGSAMAIRDDSGFDQGKLAADEITVDTTNFSKNLGSADSNAQHAFETLDQLVSGGGGTETYPLFTAWLASTYAHNIDGGFANSVYLSGQSVNGGGA